ncbi:hypothetical protein [Streptomyces sp. NPDC026673]|uniref:hypothetical protein n=1 Tax=Streptomyces sp. NPDC026673 TaxID=3155724 RepID=UPI00340D4160
MTEPTRYSAEPVVLPLHLEPDPAPTTGCGVCLALDTERTAARMRGDLSRVSDMNVEIRNHGHGDSE